MKASEESRQAANEYDELDKAGLVIEESPDLKKIVKGGELVNLHYFSEQKLKPNLG